MTCASLFGQFWENARHPQTCFCKNVHVHVRSECSAETAYFGHNEDVASVSKATGVEPKDAVPADLCSDAIQ